MLIYIYVLLLGCTSSSIIGCLVSIIVVLTSTASDLVREEMFFLTSFSLFRCAMNRTPWALQACAEVCACDHTPLRERLDVYSTCTVYNFNLLNSP